MPRLARVVAMAALVAALVSGCGDAEAGPQTPGLAPRGEPMTTVKPARQNLTNQISLAGTVTMNPVFGVTAPVAGEVRFLEVKKATSTPTIATRVASVWVKGNATAVRVPAGSTFAGRLVDDRSKVTAGMPVASARYAGYAITAEISGEQAYRVSDSLASVRAQIKNGPGPFPCAVLGTIAALPAGTLPDPPPPSAPASAPPADPPAGPGMGRSGAQEPPAGGSEPSGLKVTCTPPAGVKLINGATATVEVVTEKATNALVLPVEAVAGLHGKGKVDVVGPNRTRQTRDVALGLSDGKVVQITSGLTGSETIAVPGPDLPDAQPKPGESGDPSAPR